MGVYWIKVGFETETYVYTVAQKGQHKQKICNVRLLCLC